MNQVIECLRREEDVYINSYSKFYHVGEYDVFKVKEHIQQKINLILPENREHLVGVHIRRADNIKSIEQSPTELFINAMWEVIKKDDKAVFYLATDSHNEEKQLISEFGDRIIVNVDKELNRNSKQGIIDALIDLKGLSASKKIIGSYWSSFSETASLLDGKKELLIINRDRYQP